MPNSKSAAKRLRQDNVRRGRNRARKSALRRQVRKVREAVSGGDTERAEQEFVRASHLLDRGGTKNLIHPNKAARIKSRLQKLIRKAKGIVPKAEETVTAGE